jgi:hypothetical protein
MATKRSLKNLVPVMAPGVGMPHRALISLPLPNKGGYNGRMP